MATTGLCSWVEAELATNIGGRDTRISTLYAACDTQTATHPDTISGAATSDTAVCLITTFTDVNSAAGATYTLTLTNNKIAASSVLLVTVSYGSATTGFPIVTGITPGSGSATIVITNAHPSAAFNGSLKIGVMVVKALAELA